MPSEPPDQRGYRHKLRIVRGSAHQAVFRATHGPRCGRCGHTLWFHSGLREPGCVWLGSCDCPKFIRREPA